MPRPPICALLLLAACSDEVGIGQLHGKLVTPESLSFGDVPIGVRAQRSLPLKNEGEADFTITAITGGDRFATLEHTFAVEAAPPRLPSGGEASAAVYFEAFVEMAEPVASWIDLATDGIAESGAPIAARVALQGRGVRLPLIVEPSPVDFGTVLVGSSRTLDVRITNGGALPASLYTRLTAQGEPMVVPVSGAGTFAILTSPGSDGSLLPPGAQLAPGASILVPARFEPEPNSDGTPERATWTIASCPHPICEITVELVASGGQRGLECSPAALAFGGANPGTTVTRSVSCTNVASDPLELVDWALDANSAGAYGVDPFPAVRPALPPGATIEIAVRLSPTLADRQSGAPLTGELVVRARSQRTQDGVSPVRVPLSGAAGGPTIQVAPLHLDFGTMQVGTRDRRPLLVANAGLEPLRISMWSPGALKIAAPPAPITVLPGTSTTVEVALEMGTLGLFMSELLVHSDDAITPELAVTISAVGVDLGPCVHRVAPPSLSFGIVTLGQSAQLGVSIENVGTGSCLINRLRAYATSGTSSTTFHLPGGPEDGVMLGPGASRTVLVELTPDRAGSVHGLLDYYVSDPSGSAQNVPLFGVGLGVTNIQCPPPVTVDAGTMVPLSVTGQSQTGTTASYAWAIGNAPLGGVGTPMQWSPDPPYSPQVVFWPRLVGRYDLVASITDGLGGVATCTTAVTALAHGLRVELTWDGLGDVDLHVHNANNTPWFGRNGTEDDCFYANCSESSTPAGPIWDPSFAPYQGRNPALDIDNIVGFGPENTRIDTVGPGDTFTIALHYFWDHGHGPRVGTVNVYCGRTSNPTASYVSLPLEGVDQGGCTDNDFWKVATVTFTSSNSCQLTPIDLYQTGNAACLGF